MVETGQQIANRITFINGRPNIRPPAFQIVICLAIASQPELVINASLVHCSVWRVIRKMSSVFNVCRMLPLWLSPGAPDGDQQTLLFLISYQGWHGSFTRWV